FVEQDRMLGKPVHYQRVTAADTRPVRMKLIMYSAERGTNDLQSSKLSDIHVDK
ncbi:hypothetical protein ABVT39_020462, partial [Epinephelus coioides]